MTDQPQNPKPRKVQKKVNSYFLKNDVVMGDIPSSVAEEPSCSVRVESHEIDVNHIERDPGKRPAISSYPINECDEVQRKYMSFMLQMEADERRWEELEVDCLMNVFGRVGMESLLLDVPFVCKSCRSKGKVISLRLPPCATDYVLKYVADKCPALKELALPSYLLRFKSSYSSIIQELNGKWTNLEYLELAACYNLENFLGQISIHCKNLRRLSVANANIDKDKAMAIVSLLPKLKQLILKRANIDRGALVTLLQGCNELVHLDVSHCIGFDEGDEEIAKLASHVANFRSRGSIRLL